MCQGSFGPNFNKCQQRKGKPFSSRMVWAVSSAVCGAIVKHPTHKSMTQNESIFQLPNRRELVHCLPRVFPFKFILRFCLPQFRRCLNQTLYFTCLDFFIQVRGRFHKLRHNFPRQVCKRCIDSKCGTEVCEQRIR